MKKLVITLLSAILAMASSAFGVEPAPAPAPAIVASGIATTTMERSKVLNLYIALHAALGATMAPIVPVQFEAPDAEALKAALSRATTGNERHCLTADCSEWDGRLHHAAHGGDEPSSELPDARCRANVARRGRSCRVGKSCRS